MPANIMSAPTPSQEGKVIMSESSLDAERSESIEPTKPTKSVEPKRIDALESVESKPTNVAEEPGELSVSQAANTEQKSWMYLLFMTLATTVGGFAGSSIKQLLLPIQVSIIAPANTNTSFTIVASVGALAGFLAAPLMGALSDRTTMRWGRRRPWIIFGMVAIVAGMFIMAGATNIPILLLGEIIVQIGVDTILATVTALIPDQVPNVQHSLISAFVGFVPIAGGVLGLFLVTRLTNIRIVSEGYTLLAAISAVCIVLFLVVLREKPITREAVPPFHLGHFLASFSYPLKSSDFAYMLISRFCVYLSFTILGGYLLFYLRGALHWNIPMAASGVTMFQFLSTLLLFVTGISAGILSKRLSRLKPFALIGSLFMALGLLLMALLPYGGVLLVAAVIFGGGFGLYIGIDIALAVRVLPSNAANGKDLGIMYASVFLSLVLSPIIGGVVLNASHNNFTLLFSIAAFSSLVAAGLIIPIKSVQ